MGEYTVTAEILVRRPAADVMRWLTAPSLMAKWILGADQVHGDSVPAVGAKVTVTIYAARSFTAYAGEVTELTESRIVRCYRLAGRELPAARLTFGPAEYERTVAFDLSPAPGGVQVRCSARTVIPGLTARIADGNRPATKSLQRSLERLSACAEGRGRGLLRALAGDGGATGEAL